MDWLTKLAPKNIDVALALVRSDAFLVFVAGNGLSWPLFFLGFKRLAFRLYAFFAVAFLGAWLVEVSLWMLAAHWGLDDVGVRLTPLEYVLHLLVTSWMLSWFVSNWMSGSRTIAAAEVRHD